MSLLLHHAHPDLGPDVGVDLDPDLEVAQLADRLGEVHLALVHVDPELLELALDVARRDRAVQLVLFADLDGEREMHIGEFRRLGFGGALFGGALARDALGFVRDLLLIGLGGGVGETLREEIVARVAVLYLDDVARRPEMLHVLSQNDLHRILSLTVQARAFRRRRNSSHVSVMPMVARPGNSNSNGSATAAATTAPMTSAAGAIPNAAAHATTIAMPRTRYRPPSTTRRFSAASLRPATTGVIQPTSATMIAHTQWSPKRKSRNGAGGGPSGCRATRRCHCQARVRPASVCRARVAGTASPTEPTTGSGKTHRLRPPPPMSRLGGRPPWRGLPCTAGP